MIGTGQTALITGASSGIGLELAVRMARDGYRPILVARSEDRLHQLAARLKQEHGVDPIVIAADLSDVAAPRAIFDRLAADGVSVDVLVNNAGYTVYGEFVDSDLQAQLDMLTVNIMALTALTRLFLPAMKARRRGRVLNVASTAGFLPGPTWCCYSASKAYVVSFSEALGCELRGSGVTVTALCPGPTDTPFIERGHAGESKLYKGRKNMSAAEVAEIGYGAMRRGKPLVIAGWMNALMVFGGRFVPRTVLTRMAEHFIGRAH